MKRQILCTAFAAALTLTLAVPAAAEENKIGDVVGHTYYTDIAAQINGHPLRSYNIGGETAVVAEDLREYGFSVIWDGEARTLTVERDLEGEVTGDYQPQGQTQTVGAQAGDIYYTDIKTYVQGERVTSYAIGGETAIRFSELERTGTLTWEEEARTASLTLAEDPMEAALDELKADVEEWMAVTEGNSYWEVYPNEQGALFVGHYSGMTRGSTTKMIQVSHTGEQVELAGRLPGDLASYFVPRDIQVDDAGRYVTFYAVIRGGIDNGTGSVNGDADYHFTFDVETGKLTWEPVLPPKDPENPSGDPMVAKLNELKANVRNWIATAGPINSGWEEFPNAHGVLFVAYYAGTPHGGSTEMVQVYDSGDTWYVSGMLPSYPAPYFAPRDIQVDETGRYVTCITPVKEALDYTAGTAKDYGDCRCVFDLEEKTVTWEPMAS